MVKTFQCFLSPLEGKLEPTLPLKANLEPPPRTLGLTAPVLQPLLFSLSCFTPPGRCLGAGLGMAGPLPGMYGAQTCSCLQGLH